MKCCKKFLKRYWKSPQKFDNVVTFLTSSNHDGNGKCQIRDILYSDNDLSNKISRVTVQIHKRK